MGNGLRDRTTMVGCDNVINSHDVSNVKTVNAQKRILFDTARRNEKEDTLLEFIETYTRIRTIYITHRKATR